MRHARWTAPAAISATLLLAGPSTPFGGTHTPPVPPPPWGGPGDTGSGGAGSSGAPAPGPRPSGPAGPAAPGPVQGAPKAAAPMPGGPTTPGGDGQAPDMSEWTWWWNYNKHPYLDLKGHLAGGGVRTDGDVFALGSGQEREKTSSDPSASRAAIFGRVGPALQLAVESGSARLQSDALIAIAKLHPDFAPEGKSMRDLIGAHLRSSNQKTAESAIVALGLTGDVGVLRLLADIAKDDEAGRKCMDRTEVPARSRPLAALAMGALGQRVEMKDARRMIAHELANILEGEEGATPDLHVACVTALGICPLPIAGASLDDDWRKTFMPSSNREAQVRFLMELLETEERHEAVRAHLPKAIGLLAADASDEVRDYAKEGLLHELARLKRSDRLVRYGIVEALGLVGDADEERLDADVREALHAAVADGDNNQRGLALIAIALASSRRGEGPDPFAALAPERAYLMELLARGKSRQLPWAALALGLQSHHSREAGVAPSMEVVDAVLQGLERTESPNDAGAYFIALGLLGDPRGGDMLAERLVNTADDDARGFAAVGLGLTGERSAVALLESVVADSKVRHIPLHESSIALALLGQKQAIDPLLATLAGAKSAETKMHQLVVLGDIGDGRTVDPMVALLASDEELEQTRGFAATSLGIVCEEDALPWTAVFMNHLNYHAVTETLISGKGTGLLNLR